jgi:hypothetical protein
MRIHLLAFLVLLLLAGVPEMAQAEIVSLSGTDHVGYLSASGINTELVQPNSGLPGSKALQYPYYFDPMRGTNGLWDFVVAERLSSASTYVEQSSFSVLGKSVTDSNFGSTNFGQINFSQPVGGVGQEIISIAATDLNLNLLELSPRTYNAFRNSNNEFNWDYTIESLSLATPLNLTYQNGVLSSIDGSLAIGLAIRLAGNDSLKFKTGSSTGPVASFDGNLVFAGNTFAFAIDETQNVSTAFGDLDNIRLAFTRSGSISSVSTIPEPTSGVLLLTVGMLACCRIRASSRAGRTRSDAI